MTEPTITLSALRSSTPSTGAWSSCPLCHRTQGHPASTHACRYFSLEGFQASMSQQKCRTRTPQGYHNQNRFWRDAWRGQSARSPAQIGGANGRKSSTPNAERCQEFLFLRLCLSGDTRSATCPWSQGRWLSPAVFKLRCSHRNTERLQVFEHVFCGDVAHSPRLQRLPLEPDSGCPPGAFCAFLVPAWCPPGALRVPRSGEGA